MGDIMDTPQFVAQLEHVLRRIHNGAVRLVDFNAKKTPSVFYWRSRALIKNSNPCQI